ncbi:alpha/beta fold hydrolase [Pseudomonas prosekii]|uniref:Alpha/beta hydrolase n=1 Tax=Pseudomonas prosekii TaxID=1148509 RepID=A0A2U2D3Q0_9PSED|nr:hypothetical protein [Pseudomonas prosekii]PWE41540.1 hypothetical protein C9I49_20865 [Pseudomonas prosekii]
MTMPVLAVGGGGNGGFGAQQPENIRCYATNVEAHVLQGCGHWVTEECAPALNPLISSFWRGHEEEVARFSRVRGIDQIGFAVLDV